MVTNYGHMVVESLKPPTSVAGCELVNNIRNVAHKFGFVKQFKTYLDVSEQTLTADLRCALQRCGVSLTDCRNITPDQMVTGESYIITGIQVSSGCGHI